MWLKVLFKSFMKSEQVKGFGRSLLQLAYIEIANNNVRAGRG